MKWNDISTITLLYVPQSKVIAYFHWLKVVPAQRNVAELKKGFCGRNKSLHLFMKASRPIKWWSSRHDHGRIHLAQ